MIYYFLTFSSKRETSPCITRKKQKQKKKTKQTNLIFFYTVQLFSCGFCNDRRLIADGGGVNIIIVDYSSRNLWGGGFIDQPAVRFDFQMIPGRRNRLRRDLGGRLRGGKVVVVMLGQGGGTVHGWLKTQQIMSLTIKIHTYVGVR